MRGRGYSATLTGVEPERVLVFPPLERSINSRTVDFFVGIGRLKPGATFREAEAELNAIGKQLAEAYPVKDSDFGGYGTRVVPFDQQVLGARLPRILWILMGAVGLVLLVACVNTANLLLARGASRQAEFGVRAALGAGAPALIRQQMIEGALLARAGGAAGFGLAWSGLRLLPLVAPANPPRFDELGIDIPVLLFAVVAALIACILFAAAPAWIHTRRDLNAALRGASARTTDAGAGKLQSALVVAEFAVSLALLTGAGPFLRSLFAVASTDAGYQTTSMLFLQIDRSWNVPRDRHTAFYRQLLERVRSLPTVEAPARSPISSSSATRTLGHRARPADGSAGAGDGGCSLARPPRSGWRASPTRPSIE